MDRTSKWDGGGSQCKICHLAAEGQLHALRDCPRMKEVWRKLAPEGRTRNCFQRSGPDWLRSNFTNNDKSPRGGHWPQLFAIGCWYMWQWRNLQIHEPSFELPRNAAGIIKQRLEHYNLRWGRRESDGNGGQSHYGLMETTEGRLVLAKHRWNESHGPRIWRTCGLWRKEYWGMAERLLWKIKYCDAIWQKHVGC